MLNLAFLFCVGAIAHSVWVWFGPPSWRPRIGCNAPVFEFGERYVGDALDHRFLIRNTGRELLHITEVHMGCGCMTTPLKECLIPPGQSVDLPVYVSLEHQPAGDLKQRVIVDSNDPVSPHLLLIVKGRVTGIRNR